MHQNQLNYRSVRCMLPVAYSRKPIPILTLFALMFLSGGACLKEIAAASWAANDGKEETHVKRYVPNSCYQPRNLNAKNKICHTCNLQICHICNLQSILYKGKLLRLLGGSPLFTNEEKRGMANAIMQLNPEAITVCQDVSTNAIKVLECIAAQVARDQRARAAARTSKEWPKRSDECAICLSDLQGSLTVLPCDPAHTFHRRCIQTWVYSEVPPPAYLSRWCLKWFYRIAKSTCPLCRQNFSPTALNLVSDYCR